MTPALAARSVWIAIWGKSVQLPGDAAESFVGGTPNLGSSFICE